MKRFPQNFWVNVGALTGFVALAISGWILSDSAPHPALAGDTPGRSHKRAIRPERVTSGPGADARKNLDVIRSAGSAEDRLRATIAFANALPPSEFAAWLGGGWFNLSGGCDLRVFTEILQERWLRQDPEGLILFSIKNQSGNAGGILSTWAEREPQRVLDFFKVHPNDRLELDALWGMAKTNPGLALLRFQELAKAGLSEKAMQESDRTLRQFANTSPAALRAGLDSLPGTLRKSAESYLLGLDLSASFSQEIRKLWERPDGWEALQNISFNVKGFQEKLFGELANLPPAWKESFAASTYIIYDEAIIAKLLSADLEGDGFTVAQANRIRTAIQQRMVAAQPEAELKQIDEMGVVPSGPWDRRTNIEMRAKFDSLPEETKLPAARAIASSHESVGIDLSLTGDAIRYLIDHPDESDKIDPLRMASDYAAKLAFKDPAAASAWVQTLPDDEPKLWAQKNVARNWAIYDPQAADKWVESLPHDTRTAVQNFMKEVK